MILNSQGFKYEPKKPRSEAYIKNLNAEYEADEENQNIKLNTVFDDSPIIGSIPDSIIQEVISLEDYFQQNNFTPFLIGEVLWELMKEHYVNKPVSFTDFCRHPYFLGETLTKGHYKIWEDMGSKLYPHPLFSPYYECVLETPIGSAKSTFAMSLLLYEIYRLQQIRSPQLYYQLLAPTVISLAVMAPDFNVASDVNWRILEGFIANSEYFRTIVTLPRGKSAPDELIFPKNITIRFASKPIHLVGRAIIGGAGDEVNVSRYIQQMYRDIVNRMESRFPSSKFGGIFPGKLALLSSPMEEGSFTSERIHEDKPFTCIVQNIPIWDIKTDLPLSGETFDVFVGNNLKAAFVLTKEEEKTPDIIPYIMPVPIEYKARFDDVIVGLREFAGVRTAGRDLLFRSEEPLLTISTMPNPCESDILVLNFDDKEDRIINYFDLDYFKNPINPHSLRFMHIDVGINNDKFGISCCHAIEKEVVYYDDATSSDKVKIIRQGFIDFAFALKKPADEEVCVPKVIDFLIYLHNVLKFPIYFVSTDNYEGRVLRQYLRLEAQILTGHLSLENYIVWLLVRSIITNRNVYMPKIPLFIKEATHVVDTGKKFDHPKFFRDNTPASHDLAQAIFGSIYNVMTAERVITELSLLKELDILHKEKSLENSLYNLMRLGKNNQGNKLGSNSILNKMGGLRQ